jgi:hypothetical protein
MCEPQQALLVIQVIAWLFDGSDQDRRLAHVVLPQQVAVEVVEGLMG